MFDTVIVANGVFPAHPVPLDILHRAAHVIACDGAISPLMARRIAPTVVIGDGDSIPDEFRHLLIRIEEQEDNDLTKATHYCLRQGWTKIAYLGCAGKREDHTLGNISLLMRYYRDMDVDGGLFTNDGFFTPSQNDHTFASYPGQQVSIFNFSCTRLSSEGLKWDSYAYRELWQGTLNEAQETHFTLHADGYYLVYQTY